VVTRPVVSIMGGHIVPTVTAHSVRVSHGVVALVFGDTSEGGLLSAGAVVDGSANLVMVTFVHLVETGRKSVVMSITVVAVDICVVVIWSVVGLGVPKSHKSEHNS